MINIVINALVPLTIILAFVLLIRQPLRKKMDSDTTYRLWLLIPLSFLLYFLPLPWQHLSELNSSPLTSYLVNPSQSIEQHLSASSASKFLLVLVWFTGSTILIGYWFITHFSYQQKLKVFPVTQLKIINQVNKLSTTISLAQSSHLHSPILMGLFKQTLVIPEDFNELYSDEQQQLIIAHEVCHFSQHHMWTNQFALLLLASFWFHPLAWRAYASFRQDQEHACDQFVLSRKHTQSRIEYCKALVLAAETSPPNAFTLMSFKYNGEQNFMLNRIKQIQHMNTNQSKNKLTKLALVTIISSSLLAGISYAGNQLTQDKPVIQKQVQVQPTYRVEPKYPVEAIKVGTEGSVVLKFDVIADGSVTNVQVINAKPAQVFDTTAIEALKQWRYEATGKTTEDLLVQLDYILDDSTSTPASLVERIQVSQ